MKKLPERISRELTQLETFSPHILEASLRGMNLNQIFRDFYRVNSPRFEGSLPVPLPLPPHSFADSVNCVMNHQQKVLIFR
jgi:hypothetical protein